MTQRKKLPITLTNALTGWVGGVGGVIVFGLCYPIGFPAIVRPENYYGYGPSLIQVMLLSILVISLPALIGGIVGGRVSMEGGAGGQRMICIIFGILFSLPFACYTFWVFTGF